MTATTGERTWSRPSDYCVSRIPNSSRRALRHRSWVAETGQGPSNERLEFLGDTVLQMVVTDFIFARVYPDYQEGKLVPLRVVVLSTRTRPCSTSPGRSTSAGYLMLLGKGERT